MVDRIAFRKVGRFGVAYDSREMASLEQNANDKFRNLDALAYGPFVPSSDPLVRTSTGMAAKLAQPFEIVRYTAIPTGLVMFLPSPQEPKTGPIRFKNQGTGTAIVTIRPIATGITVDGYPVATLAGAYASAAFFPDGVRNNWIKL